MNFKRLLLFAIILGYCLSASAQFKLSGKILDYNGKAKLMVNIPLVYGFYKFNQHNLNDVKYPKVKCPETKYAESIIMTGKQFMKGYPACHPKCRRAGLALIIIIPTTHFREHWHTYLKTNQKRCLTSAETRANGRFNVCSMMRMYR